MPLFRKTTVKFCLHTTFCAGLLAGATTLSVRAAEELPGVIVEAATLEPVEASRLASAVTVVTGEELKQKQIRHAADALRSLPGVHVSRSGSFGGFTQVRIRGAEANHVLVLIDGIEVSASGTGEFDFSNLLASDIQQIEVLRGPQSGIYGSNALAGVINITTKQGKGPFQVTASVEGGSFTTDQESVSLGGSNDIAHFYASVVRRRSSGFNLSQFGDEKDGTKHISAMFKGGIQLAPNLTFDSVLRYQKKRTDDDPQDFAFPFTPTYGLFVDGIGVTEIQEVFGKAGLTLSLLDGRWKHKVWGTTTSSNQDVTFFDFFSFPPGAATSFNDGKRYKAAYQTTLKGEISGTVPSTHSLSGLVEYERETFESGSSVGKQARASTGYVFEYQGLVANRLSVFGNVRFDENEAFDDATTYRLAGAILIPETGSRIHASYGTGVTNPTFFEQFGFASGFLPNPNLSPEISEGWDVGVEQKLWDKRAVLDVTYFEANLRDEIRFVPSFPLSTVENLDGESERKGVEVSLKLSPTQNIDITGGYTYTNSKDPDGVQEVRRPEHSANLAVNYRFLNDRGQLGLNVAYNGKMTDLKFLPAFVAPFSEAVTLDDYTLVSLTGSYKVTSNMELFGRIDNVLDEDYEEIFSIETPGIAAYGGVRIKLGADGDAAK